MIATRRSGVVRDGGGDVVARRTGATERVMLCG